MLTHCPKKIYPSCLLHRCEGSQKHLGCLPGKRSAGNVYTVACFTLHRAGSGWLHLAGLTALLERSLAVWVALCLLVAPSQWDAHQPQNGLLPCLRWARRCWTGSSPPHRPWSASKTPTVRTQRALSNGRSLTSKTNTATGRQHLQTCTDSRRAAYDYCFFSRADQASHSARSAAGARVQDYGSSKRGTS